MSKIDKSPSMPLYGKDVFDDESFAQLPCAGEALFWRLAWWQWQEGSIPGDSKALLAKMPYGKVREFGKVLPVVLSLFPIGGDGRRSNPKLEEHRERLRKDRERKRRGHDVAFSDRNSGRNSGGIPVGIPPATRVADAKAIADASAFDSPEEGAGETTPAHSQLAALVEALPAWKCPHPSMLEPLTEHGLSTEEILAEIRPHLDKPLSYWLKCVESAANRKRLASGIGRNGDTNGRRNLDHGSAGANPPVSRFHHRTLDESEADDAAAGVPLRTN